MTKTRKIRVVKATKAKTKTKPADWTLTFSQAFAKATSGRADLKDVWEEVIAFFRMARSWRRGKYKHIPANTIVGALEAIITRPGPLAVANIVRSLRHDIKRFREWEELHLPWYRKLANKGESFFVRKSVQSRAKKGIKKAGSNVKKIAARIRRK